VRSSRPGATSRLTVLAVTALAAGCATGAYGDNFGAESGDFANSGGSSSGSLGAGTDNGGSALSGSFGGAAAGSGGGYDAGSGRDNAIDAAGDDASSAASHGGQAESGGPLSTGLSILYKVEVQQTTSAYVGCQLSITNSGTGAPQVSALRARYYFTDEVHLTPQLKINWSHISTSGPNTDVTVTYAFAPVVPAAPGADTYIEFSFSSAHPLLGPGESAVFSWQMQGPDPSKNLYNQTNDYSFDSSKTSLASWERVLLLQNGSVVWGRSP
jgi:Cellulose binding domain